VRARGGNLVDVGPRSAHIAGLPYAAFAKPEDIVDPAIEFFQPKADDPADYVAVRSVNGTRYAITNTCAANILGYAKPGLHASGNRESAERAMAALAKFIGKSIEDTARAILDIATDKVIPVVDDLIAEYKLDRDQALLVGEGGGAAALIPHASARTGRGAENSGPCPYRTSWSRSSMTLFSLSILSTMRSMPKRPSSSDNSPGPASLGAGATLPSKSAACTLTYRKPRGASSPGSTRRLVTSLKQNRKPSSESAASLSYSGSAISRTALCAN